LHQQETSAQKAKLLREHADAMVTQNGIFTGDDPFEIAKRWLGEATQTEINDPNAMSLATVDQSGMPNVRVVLLKEIEADAFVFYTNYDSRKAQEIEATGRAAFVLHWKSLGRQIRVRGNVTREDGPQADAYFASRSQQSRIGAWASRQSQPLSSRDTLMKAVQDQSEKHGENPLRPPNWGGFRVVPTEIEFWADGEFRLHDRYRWTRDQSDLPWLIAQLYP